MICRRVFEIRIELNGKSLWNFKCICAILCYFAIYRHNLQLATCRSAFAIFELQTLQYDTRRLRWLRVMKLKMVKWRTCENQHCMQVGWRAQLRWKCGCICCIILWNNFATFRRAFKGDLTCFWKVIWRDETLQCLKLLINLCKLMLLCDLQEHGFDMRKLLHDLIDWKFQTSLWDSAPFYCDLLAIMRMEKAAMVAIDNILKWPVDG